MKRLVIITTLLVTPIGAQAYATKISPAEACMGYSEAAEELLNARHGGATKDDLLERADDEAYLAMVEEVFDLPRLEDPAEQALARVAYGDETLTACLDHYAEASNEKK
ncbi:hypothetical protein [Litchfieldella xinjiangensis]|uniref:hypothetical protein n=1 Tax=Litchfieldella xinjiangensis TaxID=1166948 RepID=UPI0005BC9393|nr:hypothetical protein [Halomonas xinjiangensis]